MGKYKKIVKKVYSSSELYQEIFGNTTAKGRRSLINLKKMCDSLEKRGLEITVSILGREAERLGVTPRKEALRNNPRLREYVQKRNEEQVLVSGKVVVDSDLNEVVKMLMRENFTLRAFIKNMSINQ